MFTFRLCSTSGDDLGDYQASVPRWGTVTLRVLHRVLIWLNHAAPARAANITRIGRGDAP
jgi:hypothetical protein